MWSSLCWLRHWWFLWDGLIICMVLFFFQSEREGYICSTLYPFLFEQHTVFSFSFFCDLGVDQLSWVDVSRHPTTSYQSLWHILCALGSFTWISIKAFNDMVVFMNCIYAGILFCGLDYMFHFICWLALTHVLRLMLVSCLWWLFLKFKLLFHHTNLIKCWIM